MNYPHFFQKLIVSNWLSLRNRHFLLIDLLILCLTPAVALLLRTDAALSVVQYAQPLLLYTLLSAGLKLPLFFAAGFYRRFWRYASLEELVLIGVIGLLSMAAGLIAAQLLAYTSAWTAFTLPRSVPFIDALLVTISIGSFRFSVRLAERWRIQHEHANATRVAIVGAGAAGDLCYREIERTPDLGLKVVGFFDDDPLKAKAKIHSVMVLGTRADMATQVLAHSIDQVIVAMPSASGKIIREIVAQCESLGVEVKTMPSLSEMITSDFSLRSVRKIELSDLLRRAPIQTDAEAVRRLLAGKCILITGGGGSIGGEICRQVLMCKPSKLVVLGHGENSVFEINQELRQFVKSRFPHGQAPKIETVIADIRFVARLHALFQKHRPDIVFHAAAHKHVPLMEQHPTEAVDNNIFGTSNVLTASVAASVERFVMISSDKAVNPTNVMGATKRGAELLVHQTAEKTGLPYVAVRFGNVLGSRGSVVLTFKEQIAQGGPISVTDPEIQRFFMTIPEAVQLVLQAAVLGTGGEVFMLDMGEPIKIVQLAKDLIELSGLEVGEDIDIVYSGLRPGEKLYEELFIEGEEYGRTAHQKILTVTNASTFVPDGLGELIEALTVAVQRSDDEAIIRLLRMLVPEYEPVPTAQREMTKQREKVQSLQPQLAKVTT